MQHYNYSYLLKFEYLFINDSNEEQKLSGKVYYFSEEKLATFYEINYSDNQSSEIEARLHRVFFTKSVSDECASVCNFSVLGNAFGLSPFVFSGTIKNVKIITDEEIDFRSIEKEKREKEWEEEMAAYVKNLEESEESDSHLTLVPPEKNKYEPVLNDYLGFILPQPIDYFIDLLIDANKALAQGTISNNSIEDNFNDRNFYYAMGLLDSMCIDIYNTSLYCDSDLVFFETIKCIINKLIEGNYTKENLKQLPSLQLYQLYTHYYKEFISSINRICSHLGISTISLANKNDLVGWLLTIQNSLSINLSRKKPSYPTLNILSKEEALRMFEKLFPDYIDDKDSWVYFLSGSRPKNRTQWNDKIIWKGTVKDLVLVFAIIGGTFWSLIADVFISANGKQYKKGTLASTIYNIRNLRVSINCTSDSTKLLAMSEEYNMNEKRIHHFCDLWEQSLNRKIKPFYEMAFDGSNGVKI